MLQSSARKRAEAVLDRLKSLHPKVIDLSLGRVERLLSRLGHPERRLPPVLHVAGTNGKGSTLAFVRALAEAHGCKVHLYTSPHLVRFNERIVVSGKEIEDEALVFLLEECERINAGAPITYFEITTAAAFLAFADAPADYTLLETGLGGRLDATNVITRPELTAITAISHDHQTYLGESLREIAFEKAGVLKTGVRCHVVRQQPEAAEVISTRALDVGVPLLWEGEAWTFAPSATGFRFATPGRTLELPLPGLQGAHQLCNAGLAISCFSHLAGEKLDPKALAEGIGAVRWPARLQRLTTGSLASALPPGWELWLDGAHNPGAAEVLATHLRNWADRPICLILGMLRSKDLEEFLRLLTPLVHRVLAVAIPGENASFDPQTVASVASGLGAAAEPAPSVKGALDILSRDMRTPSRVLICGSLYLAGSVLKENDA